MAMELELTAPKRISDWFVVAGTAIGLILCGATFAVSTFGVLTSYLTKDLGWTQAAMSPGLSIYLISSVISLPIIGRLVDRFGTRPVALCGIVAFAMTLASGALMSGSVWSLYAFYFLVGVVGGFTNPVVYVRAISLLFEENRGLALGLAVAGQGAGATFLPKIMSLLSDNYGWRMSLVAFGAALLVMVFPIVAAFVRDKPRGDGQAHASAAREKIDDGLTAMAAAKTVEFWILIASFGLFGLASYGLVGEFIYLMTNEHGVSIGTASALMGAVGLSTVLGRVVFGLMMDRWHAPRVGTIGTLIFGIGSVLLIYGHGLDWTAILCPILLGVSFGSETDLLTLLVSRYFGKQHVGQIYGWATVSYAITGAGGTVLFAYGVEHFGGYAETLWVFAGLAVLSGILLLFLGPYPDFAGGSATKSTAAQR